MSTLTDFPMEAIFQTSPLTDARYLWNGARSYVEIDPQVSPAHIFKLRRHVRTERDFDYFL